MALNQERSQKSTMGAMVDLGGGWRDASPHQPKHNVLMNTCLKKAISE